MLATKNLVLDMQTEALVYTIPECAVLLAVSKNTIYRLVEEGVLEAIHIKGKYRIRKSAVERYLDNATRIRRESLVRFG